MRKLSISVTYPAKSGDYAFHWKCDLEIKNVNITHEEVAVSKRLNRCTRLESPDYQATIGHFPLQIRGIQVFGPNPRAISAKILLCREGW